MRIDTNRVGVPTEYKGIVFRSRLEARWAVMFDLLHWEWQYEPFDLSWYIPDFIISFKRAKLLIEVKPAIDYKDLEGAVKKTALSGWNKDFLIVGTRPFTPGGDDFHRSFGELHLWDRETHAGWQPADHGMFVRCDCCRLVSIRHASAGWFCISCGNNEPREYLTDMRARDVDALWAHAGNEAQWRKKGPR